MLDVDTKSSSEGALGETAEKSHGGLNLREGNIFPACRITGEGAPAELKHVRSDHEKKESDSLNREGSFQFTNTLAHLERTVLRHSRIGSV